MKFKSKTGIWFHALKVLMAALALWLIIVYVTGNNNMSAVCACLIMLCEIYTSVLSMTTYYVLEDGGLRIRSGPGKGRLLPYGDIISAAAAEKGLLMGAALSFDQVEIRFRDAKRGGKEDFTRISPDNKEEFIEKLGEKLENR